MAILVPPFELAEKIGKNIEIDAPTVRELIAIGIERYGEEFRAITRLTIIVVNGRAINHLKDLSTPLGKDDQVWLLRPAAGG